MFLCNEIVVYIGLTKVVKYLRAETGLKVTKNTHDLNEKEDEGCYKIIHCEFCLGCNNCKNENVYLFKFEMFK